MSSYIVNLTEKLVLRELEDILADCQGTPFAAAFAIPHMRHQLVASVLSQVRNKHVVVSDAGGFTQDPDAVNYCLEEQLHLNAVIRQRMMIILYANPLAKWQPPVQDVDSFQ